MLDFLRRIPAMLGLKRGGGAPAKAPPKLTLVKDGEPEVKRGRGVGRGVTPPAKPKPRPGAAQRRKK
jgi:hypothetical protein